jgi:hypothetical protein
MMMAGSVLTVIPVLLLFLVLQRYYLQGLLAAASRDEAGRAGSGGAGAWRLRPAGRRAPARRLQRHLAVAGTRVGRRDRDGARAYEGGLRLDYDFSRGSGYAISAANLPSTGRRISTCASGFRGSGPANALEVKLVDASGENVWWHRRADYVPPGEWRTIRVRRRQVDFAWGPVQDRSLRRTASVESSSRRGAAAAKAGSPSTIWSCVPRTPAPVEPLCAWSARARQLAMRRRGCGRRSSHQLDARSGAADRSGPWLFA